jgi:2-C-methyl-D-erythritol 4-phosphate cytidylyltransferase / 2-C-methyl-D-erythritol 2,4-cyclodiphosphate synthase
MHVAAIIVAAGRGERAGAKQPKQFVDLGGGRTMVGMSVAALLAAPRIDHVIVAVPAGFADRMTPDERVTVIEGGARRQDSMAAAFAQVPVTSDIVLVHDAARPFVTAELIAATVDAAAQYGAAIAALPVRDTVKRTTREGDGRRITETIPRDEIFLAQTPQAFRRDVLAEALEAAAGADVTDEAMLVERAGIPVRIVEGDPHNVKVTTPDDLARARAPGPSERALSAMRIGTGYDLHRLVSGRPLILAGVTIPFDKGLQGHSDADIVCHAVTDAILGAAAAGDIGLLFPDTDAAWKGADSVHLLRTAVERVRAAGLTVVNIDVTVIAERPKLRPYIEVMRANLAAAIAVHLSAVSIKGKTNETVDATGRGEAMACHAIALLVGART